MEPESLLGLSRRRPFGRRGTPRRCRRPLNPAGSILSVTIPFRWNNDNRSASDQGPFVQSEAPRSRNSSSLSTARRSRRSATPLLRAFPSPRKKSPSRARSFAQSSVAVWGAIARGSGPGGRAGAGPDAPEPSPPGWRARWRSGQSGGRPGQGGWPSGGSLHPFGMAVTIFLIRLFIVHPPVLGGALGGVQVGALPARSGSAWSPGASSGRNTSDVATFHQSGSRHRQ